jgi:hypothetical protein
MRSWNADAGGANEISGFGNDTVSPRPAGPVERTLAESHGHRCVVYRDGEFYDKAPEPHGRFYLGKAQSDADAVSRWRGWLRSQGLAV